MLLKENISGYQENHVNTISIQEGGYIVKTMSEVNEKIQAHKLRHEMFSEELKWAPKTENRLEIDVYDSYAVFFGVFDLQNRLLAHMRLVLAEDTFMIEKEFLSLMGPHAIRKERDTAELSRCCVAPEARKYLVSTEHGRFDIFSLLFKGIYLWCIKNDIRYIYGVTDHRVYKLLQLKGLPFKLVDSPCLMEDGVVAMAIQIDWYEFRLINKTKRPLLLSWFNRQAQSASDQAQLQQYETGLQCSVFA